MSCLELAWCFAYSGGMVRFRHCLNNVIGKRGRVWASEANALQPLDLASCAETG